MRYTPAVRRSVLRLALAASATLVATGASAQAIDKVAAHERMKVLVAAIVDARNSNDPGRVDAAQAELSAISASLGGDLPVAQGPGVRNIAQPNVAPPPPAGGTITTTTATQSSPTVIPTGPAVVTSTVVVAGAGTYLWDVDITTGLQHTFAADLDVTIQSPAGTIVTLTTDNGAGNDNVFDGTLWDDQANPAGQVPYTTNNGLVTDHAYVNLTLASPLVPEEGLAAFRGENPNGTWTITISDDLAGDGGTLNSWSVVAHTLGSPPVETTTTTTQSTPTAIPTGPAVATSTLAVSGAGTTITNIVVNTTLTHTFSADLDITLQGPGGQIVTFTTDNGAGNDNTYNGTAWNVDANPAGQVPYTTNNGIVTDHAYVNLTTATPLATEESLGAFLGTNPNGTWTMTISDDLAGDGGSLDSWSLVITTGTGVLPLTANPPSGSTINVGQGPGGSRTIAFTNPNGTPATVNCSVAPTGSFTVTPVVTVPAGGTANATVTFTPTGLGAFTATVTCTSGQQTFTYTVNGAGGLATISVPTWGDSARWLAILMLLGIGLAALVVRKH
jgi:subtilisin-like proprotein convertase family protein